MTYETDIARLVQLAQPKSLLVVGDGKPMFEQYLQLHPKCKMIYHTDGRELDGLKISKMFDLAFVSGVLEHLESAAAGFLISRLRDMLARRIILVVPIGGKQGFVSHWTQNDMIAYGMTRIGKYGDDENLIGVFTFDLHDYKPTPDWLNSQYWANPELFGKHWW